MGANKKKPFLFSQSPWTGEFSQPAASTPGVQPTGDLATTTSASPDIPAVAPAIAPVNCNWTEHMSPDGYKYYYNSLTGESKVNVSSCVFAYLEGYSFSLSFGYCSGRNLKN